MEAPEPIRNIAKAGIILFDRGGLAPGKVPEANSWDDKRGVQVLATYTQGRFDAHGIYHVPPKGSIDLGETPLMAAVRECHEETGVDIHRLLGAHYPDFLMGKSIENVASTGYPGVTVVHASSRPVEDHVYVSGHGSRQRAQYFAVEVKGIEALKQHLKCVVPGEHELPPEKRRLSSALAAEKGLPGLEAMMDILRTGVVPVVKDAAWSAESPQRIIAEPKLPAMEKAWLVERQRDHDQLQAAEWLEFVADPAIGKAYKGLSADLDALKKYLEGTNLVGDGGGCLKLDTKERHLDYYKEGGEIVRLSHLVTAMDRMATKNPVYARAVWGEYAGHKLPDVSSEEQLKRAQIAPMLSFLAGIAPMEIASAAIDIDSRKRANALQVLIGMADPVVHSVKLQGKGLATAAGPTATDAVDKTPSPAL